ncbi:hypothetical protein EV385_6457 [Krasilnikovia cinnamomea]|uniref:Uncharacterized protein n=1 Tax=Krasilnikovia cinnamomea TaxID=349313 RepID=A0A4V2G7Z7_9ACTN|nr:hypothetical protein [Krasilnikovia cinnamomea]RZU54506.1 hypothetical protein EV385_6457 [Krasilnikovia cinnamomea]
MASQAWNDDELLLQDLAAALRTAQPLTPALQRAGEAAFAWRTIDEELELASLVFDSVLEPELAAVRGPDVENYRTVLFEGRSVSVQVERSGDVVVGQVMPPQPGKLSVEGANGHMASVDVDELGCFSLDELPAEPIRLRWEADATRLVTGWMRF